MGLKPGGGGGGGGGVSLPLEAVPNAREKNVENCMFFRGMCGTCGSQKGCQNCKKWGENSIQIAMNDQSSSRGKGSLMKTTCMSCVQCINFYLK